VCTFLLFFFVFSGCTRGNLDCTVLQFCVPIKKQTLLTKELVVLGSVQTNFIKNSNSNQIKWRKGICQTAAHHHHALIEVASFNPFGGVPIPEKMGDPVLGLNCMHTHP